MPFFEASQRLIEQFDPPPHPAPDRSDTRTGTRADTRADNRTDNLDHATEE